MKPQHTKPRNPLVAAARFRHAGAHQKTEKALRRQAAVSLMRQLRRKNDEGAWQAGVGA